MAGRENTLPARGWTALPPWTPEAKIQAGLIRPYDAALTNALLERVTSITSSLDGSPLTPPDVAVLLHIQQIDDDGYEEEDSDHVPGVFFNLNTGMAFLADHEADHFMVIDFNNWSVRPVHKTFCRVKWASGNTERDEHNLRIKVPGVESTRIWVRNLPLGVRLWWEDYIDV